THVNKGCRSPGCGRPALADRTGPGRTSPPRSPDPDPRLVPDENRPCYAYSGSQRVCTVELCSGGRSCGSSWWRSSSPSPVRRWSSTGGPRQVPSSSQPCRCPGRPAGAPGLGDPYFPGAGNGGYDVQSYRLELRYDPDPNELDGHAVIAATATQDLATFNLDFGSLDIAAITVNGRAAHAQHTAETELRVTPAALIANRSTLTIDARYRGKPPGDGSHPTEDGASVLGEPNAATAWFPSNDHPRDKATYDFSITVPAGLNAIANGVLRGQSTSDGWTT